MREVEGLASEKTGQYGVLGCFAYLWSLGYGETMKHLFPLLLLLVLLVGCGAHSTEQVPTSPPPLPAGFSYWQIGQEFFLSSPERLIIHAAQSVKEVPGGWLVRPKKSCVKVIANQTVHLCLKKVPPVQPRVYLSRVGSHQVELKVISLFKTFIFFRWEEGQDPDYSRGRRITGHLFRDTDLPSGKTLFYSAAVYVDDHLLGPLSEPVKVVVHHRGAPASSPGGGVTRSR